MAALTDTVPQGRRPDPLLAGPEVLVQVEELLVELREQRFPLGATGLQIDADLPHLPLGALLEPFETIAALGEVRLQWREALLELRAALRRRPDAGIAMTAEGELVPRLGRSLPFALTAPRVRRLCDRHAGPGADGVLELSPPDAPGFVARLRVFNPDGSEAELSGNGAREAIMYLRRRGWTGSDTFSIETAAGEIRPTITGETTCTVDMGRAKLAGDGTLTSADREFAYQHITIGNPQTAIEVADLDFDLPTYGAPIESNTELFPNRTNVSFWRRDGDGEITARIYERGVGETMSSGTGACGAAIAHVLRGGDSPVTVKLDGGELEVDVAEDLHVNLTGWAVPVYRGELAGDLIEELDETE